VGSVMMHRPPARAMASAAATPPVPPPMIRMSVDSSMPAL
jgi:hypothetical protein